jgi:hypothetical protein
MISTACPGDNATTVTFAEPRDGCGTDVGLTMAGALLTTGLHLVWAQLLLGSRSRTVPVATSTVFPLYELPHVGGQVAG